MLPAAWIRPFPRLVSVPLLAGAVACATPPAAPPEAAASASAPRPECETEALTPAQADKSLSRAAAVYRVWSGCPRAGVAGRHGASATDLASWESRFYLGGARALLTPAPATVAEVQAAFAGTWRLESRVAKGRIRGEVDGLMVYTGEHALVVESGILSDDFAPVGLGPHHGEPFRIAQLSLLRFRKDEDSPFVVRIAMSHAVGSYSDYPRGIQYTRAEPFAKRGGALLYYPPPMRGYSPDTSNHMLLLGDRMQIVQLEIDVVDTWVRVRPDAPLMGGTRDLQAAWKALKARGTLLEKSRIDPAALLEIPATELDQ